MTDDFRSADEQELRAGVRALAREDAALQAPDDVEARVMRAWDAAHTASPARRRFVSRGWQMAAAVVLLAVGTYWWTTATSRPASPADSDRQEHATGPALPSDEIQAWLDLDPGALQIVRVGVSRATLVAQGYAVSDPDGDGLVEIDVVVGADGVARTVQLAAAPLD
jgi:hypothetical protein